MRVGTTVMGVGDMVRATRFWSEALGYERRPGGTSDDWVVLVPPGDVGPGLALGLSESPPELHPRVHLDLYSAEPEEEIERLIGLGAERVDWDLYPDEPDFVVLADTEGNRFCVIDTGWVDRQRNAGG